MIAQLLQLLDWRRIRNKPAYASVLHNLTATAAPTTGDDSGDGYAVGSRWIDVSANKEYVCLDASVGAAVWTETTQSGGGTVDRSINMFRITTESGVPVSTSDRTAQTTIYACPAAGGATEEAQISLLGTDDATWETHDTAQMSIGLTTTRNGTTTNGAATITGLATTVDLVVGQEITGTGIGAGAVIASIDSATQVTASANSTADGTVAVTFKCPASKNYDLFVVNIAGTPTLVFGPAWTSDTARATDIIQKDGVPVLSGAFVVGGVSYAEGRLRRVGGVAITAIAGQTEWVCSQHGSYSLLIESEDNKATIPFMVVPGYNDNNSNTTLTISAATPAEINGGVQSRITWFGDNVSVFAILGAGMNNSNAAGYQYAAIALDTVAGNKSEMFGAGTTFVWGSTACAPSPQTGRHSLIIYAWRSSYNATWYVDAARGATYTEDAPMSSMCGEIQL
jgi:hypothetical protein